jgi:hypothetical protein
VAYQVNGGRIQTWALEAHVVDQCNLRCEECCSLSPYLGERATSADELRRDLIMAARVLRPAVLKLTGGEPLLHPDIVRCADAARAAGIAEVLSITTNGFHAPRVDEGLWERIDRMTLSLYPSAPLPEKTLELVRERCARHGVALTEKPAARFQRMTPAEIWSEEQARGIYDGCWLKVRCHLVHGGRFYTCTRPPHLAQLGYAIPDGDGVDLGGDDVLATLMDYLESPLEACRFCLGASGERFVHRQLGRGELRVL